MKIIDEKGRLFGKLNLLDLLALLVLAAAVVFFGLRLIRGRDSGTSSVERVHLKYTVLLEAIDERSVPELQKAVGEQILSNGEYVDRMILTDCVIEPCRLYSKGEDGLLTETVDKDHVNAVCTVEGTVEWAKHAAQVGTQEVRAGKDNILKTKTIEFSGKVLTMEVDGQ